MPIATCVLRPLVILAAVFLLTFIYAPANVPVLAEFSGLSFGLIFGFSRVWALIDSFVSPANQRWGRALNGTVTYGFWAVLALMLCGQAIFDRI